MPIRFSLNVKPDRQAQKTEVVRDELAQPPLAGQIICVIGDTVPLYRSMEILEGWMKLWNGIRDRGLLSPDLTNGASGPIFTAFSIDSRTENNRRTSWADIGSFLNTDDILIGVHDNLAAGSSGNVGAVNMLQNAFQMVSDHVRESQELA